ncbi:MAG: CoA-binding protein [Bryobacteraceae bacterium]
MLGSKHVSTSGCSKLPQPQKTGLCRTLPLGKGPCSANSCVADTTPFPSTRRRLKIEGRCCYARVQQIEPPVECMLIAVPPKQAESIVLDCAAGGVSRVWLYRAVGEGAVSRAAVRYCRSKGIRVMKGRCPYMFWDDAAWFHRLHGLLLKIGGHWPH